MKSPARAITLILLGLCLSACDRRCGPRSIPPEEWPPFADVWVRVTGSVADLPEDSQCYLRIVQPDGDEYSLTEVPVRFDEDLWFDPTCEGQVVRLTCAGVEGSVEHPVDLTYNRVRLRRVKLGRD